MHFLASFGIPAASLFAILAALNESLIALLVAAGFLTRRASLIAALGMFVAFSISMKLGEDPLRALLYLFIFGSLAIAGPGRIWIDSLRARKT